MNVWQIITTDTPDGAFHIIIDQNGVAHASGFGAADDLIKRLPEALQNSTIEPVATHPYQKLVLAYYEGDGTALAKIPQMQNGSDFQLNVWNAISAVPYGKTISYKALAEASGKPAAIRAAGTICGLNRLILLVPCHRVLKSDGSIGSYLYGPEIKKSLLQHEGAITK
jgi:methylated-DNA-[protein]-cysteine S-methyltransferase